MKLKAGEKGFTLLELLVALSIAAFVIAAASMTIITMMRLSPQSNNWAVALRQVQNTGYWISRDVMMSDTVTPGTGDTFLTLTQPQINNSPPKNIVYQFANIDGEQWLVRTESIGGSIVGQTAIAQYISMPDTTATYDDVTRTLTLKVTAISGNVPVTKRYETAQRVPAPAPPP
jgi:prepilin-type N-terminal cleavage/methylation domain-containing protein